MLQIILFTVAGMGLYLFSEWFLNLLERMHGSPIPHRNLVFFVIIFLLTMTLFQMIRVMVGDIPSADEMVLPADPVVPPGR